MKTFVIAEAGSNHNRDYNMALKMIDVAVDAGCDAVKFQLFKSDKMYSKYTPDFAGYEKIPELIKSIETPREWIPNLKQYCDEKNIEFFASPFDEEAVDLLADIGVKRIKIAGFESNDLRFLNYVLTKKIPLVVSIGANVSNELLRNIIHTVLYSDVDILGQHYFLHVIQSYPTPINEIALCGMNRISQYVAHYTGAEYQYGLSDHTEGILIPPVAVAMGAKCIEKHFTLDRTLPGPDHKFAIEPNELKEMVKNIRLVESALTTRNLVQDCEKEMVKAKRAIYASRDIQSGEKLTEENLTTKRPCMEGNIPADEYYYMIDRSYANKNILKDEPITVFNFHINFGEI